MIANTTIFAFLGLILAPGLAAKQVNYELRDAVDKKLVSVKAYSHGTYKGSCMTLNVLNLTKDSMRIMIAAGTRLNSVDEKRQDILIVRQTDMVLAAGEKKSSVIKGYCCQATHFAPAVNSIYFPDSSTDSNLVKLALFLGNRNFSQDTEQQAVWSVSDKKPISLIPDSTEALQSLRLFVAALSGLEIPWYSLHQKEYVINGIIVSQPLCLKGSIPVSCDSEKYITCTIIGKDGLPAGEIRSGWMLAGANRSYEVDLPVRSLPQGKYKIRLTAKNEVLATREFEL